MSTAATGALHPDLSRCAQEIRDTLANFESLCTGLSDTQFNWSPEPGRWSIAQYLTHLNSVNRQDLATMPAAIATATRRHPGPYNYSWLWRCFIQSMEPPVKTKFKVPKNYEPPPNANLHAALSEHHRISPR